MRIVLKSWMVASLMVCVALAGCVEKKSDSEELQERARAYWEAMRVNDLITIYQMEAASLDGRLIAADMRNMLNLPSRLLSYTIQPPVISGDTAMVDVDLKLTKPGMKGTGFDIPTRNDHWSRIDGTWYHGRTKDAVAPPGSPSPSVTPQGDASSPSPSLNPSSAPGSAGKN